VSTPNEPDNKQNSGASGPARGTVVPPWQRGQAGSGSTRNPVPMDGGSVNDGPVGSADGDSPTRPYSTDVNGEEPTTELRRDPSKRPVGPPRGVVSVDTESGPRPAEPGSHSAFQGSPNSSGSREDAPGARDVQSATTEPPAPVTKLENPQSSTGPNGASQNARPQSGPIPAVTSAVPTTQVPASQGPGAGPQPVTASASAGDKPATPGSAQQGPAQQGPAQQGPVQPGPANGAQRSGPPPSGPGRRPGQQPPTTGPQPVIRPQGPGTGPQPVIRPQGPGTGPQPVLGKPASGQPGPGGRPGSPVQPKRFAESPTAHIERRDLPGEDLPNLDKIHHVANGAEHAGGARRSAPVQVGGSGGVRAAVQVRRIDPWATFKVSAVLTVVGFFIWMIAIAVLYLVLGGMGVWDQLNSSFNTLTTDGTASESDVIGTGSVFFWSGLIGAISAVLITALATVGSYIYNICADLVGGVEITIADLD